MFHIKFINKKRVIYSDIILDTEHFFTTRETVIRSEEKNLQELIAQNKEDVCKYLNIPQDKLLTSVQTHSANIRIVSPKILTYPNSDALIIDETSLAIYLNFADCTPIILYDKKHNIGAIVHAGWRGTVAKIAIKTVEQMKETYLSNVNDIYAVIGPSIAICCYNVGEDVYKQLKSSVSNILPFENHIYDKIYVDLKGINKQQLIDIGISKDNIDVCPYCTSCNNDMFFSYRKEHGTTSRHSAILKLKNRK
ncbi:MAG: peptidoglycan editing factor PgeF [Candidatus Gastranaerophilaceae bacterium]